MFIVDEQRGQIGRKEHFFAEVDQKCLSHATLESFTAVNILKGVAKNCSRCWLGNNTKRERNEEKSSDFLKILV